MIIIIIVIIKKDIVLLTELSESTPTLLNKLLLSSKLKVFMVELYAVILLHEKYKNGFNIILRPVITSFTSSGI